MKSIKTLIPAAVLFTAILAGGAALAHDDAYLDTQQTPNGGQLRMAGAYHYELVVARGNKEAQNAPVFVYVTDHAGAKIPTVGAGGTVTLLAGKAKTTVSLVPDGDNRLKGAGKYVSAPDMKAIVSVTLAGQAAEQARFTPLAVPKALAAADTHMDHKH